MYARAELSQTGVPHQIMTGRTRAIWSTFIEQSIGSSDVNGGYAGRPCGIPWEGLHRQHLRALAKRRRGSAGVHTGSKLFAPGKAIKKTVTHFLREPELRSNLSMARLHENISMP